MHQTKQDQKDHVFAFDTDEFKTQSTNPEKDNREYSPHNQTLTQSTHNISDGKLFVVIMKIVVKDRQHFGFVETWQVR
jgi:hypothetical protein